MSQVTLWFLTAVIMIAAFWDVMSCSLVYMH